ncbi:MAG2-interacting protein 2 isoform X1 [Iris pallida]|uniref:MAG2-interacting protein 2 isoform X1 n=1 Tax=Iris pallida TaxID=29817 RepID=A0AAX6E0J8_IRIPA|nr:MAG2-interacting protein 2 isoform X1 [Iris pallida]
MISSIVYPEIDGRKKQRLSYIYSILSACYLRLRKDEETGLVKLSHKNHQHRRKLEPFQFYKVLEQECQSVSSIDALNFKNIAGLDDLNFENFNEEIFSNIHESTVDILANMVRALAGIYDEKEDMTGLISWHDVYKHHILECLASLERGMKETSINNMSSGELQSLIEKIELKYDSCKKYVRSLPEAERSYIIGKYCVLCIPPEPWRPSDDSAWKDCLAVLLSFWIKMVDDEGFHRKHLAQCLNTLRRLVMEEEISAYHGWNTLTGYINLGVKGDLTTDIFTFFRSVIFSGCGFKSVAEIYSEVHSTNLTSDGKFNNLAELYISLTDKALLELSSDSGKNQDLLHLLSSLSRLDEVGSYMEDLKTIRSHVWGKLSAYSDDMQLESYLRVYALELMQAITGQNLSNLPDELVSKVKPWEAWENSYFTKNSSWTVSQQAEGSASTITNTLIALKSSQLVTAISPNVKITAEDLMTLDSAVSCFLHLSELSTSLSHLHVLQAVLEEWEVLFSARGVEHNVTAAESSVEEMNDWSNGEWDNEGWENLPEEEPGKMEGKQDVSTFVRPLHACWMETIRRLVGISKPTVAIELLDSSSSKADTVGVLLEEDEAQQLYQLVVGIDCFMALKMLLLLPYRGPQIQCLGVIDAKLKNVQGTATNTLSDAANDHELLILVLSSGVLKDIVVDPSFGRVFSYLCHMMGNLAHLCQQGLLTNKNVDEKRLLVFVRLLLPCFISELVQAGQSLLAGFIVSQWMHTHSSLGLIDIVEASLRRYLEVQLSRTRPPPNGEGVDHGELQSSGSLVHSVSRLREKVGSLLESAISALSSNITR